MCFNNQFTTSKHALKSWFYNIWNAPFCFGRKKNTHIVIRRVINVSISTFVIFFSFLFLILVQAEVSHVLFYASISTFQPNAFLFRGYIYKKNNDNINAKLTKKKRSCFLLKNSPHNTKVLIIRILDPQDKSKRISIRQPSRWKYGCSQSMFHAQTDFL